MDDQFLKRLGASEYLRERYGISVAPATLNRMASQGGGPEFQRFGRTPYYTREQLDRWVAQRMTSPATSTSQFATRPAPVGGARPRGRPRKDGGARRAVESAMSDGAEPASNLALAHPARG